MLYENRDARDTELWNTFDTNIQKTMSSTLEYLGYLIFPMRTCVLMRKDGPPHVWWATSKYSSVNKAMYGESIFIRLIGRLASALGPISEKR